MGRHSEERASETAARLLTLTRTLTLSLALTRLVS